jgi:hypothetical protein
LSDPEEQAAIVIGEVAAARTHILRLRHGTGGDPHAGSQGIPVAPAAGQRQADPVAAMGGVVAEQTCRLVVAREKDIGIAVVVIIPERGSPRHLTLGEEAAALPGDIGEQPVSLVAEELARLRVAKSSALLIGVVIHMAIRDEQIQEAVQVQVHEAAAPL